jgi:hypothetical protein
MDALCVPTLQEIDGGLMEEARRAVHRKFSQPWNIRDPLDVVIGADAAGGVQRNGAESLIAWNR